MIHLNDETKKKWQQEPYALEKEASPIFSKEIIKKNAKISKYFLKIHETLQKEIGYGKSFLSFSNLPIGTSFDFPKNARKPYNKGFLSELCLLGITKACGLTLIGSLEEKNAALVHEITPILKENNKSISSKGILAFDFHTDASYLPRYISLNTLSLICSENTKGTATHLVLLNNIIKDLSKETLEILQQPRYAHASPETFKVSNKESVNSVLYIAALHNIKPLDKKALDAIDALKTSTTKKYIKKAMKTGRFCYYLTILGFYMKEGES